jgi:hypothetical protein
MMRALVVVCLLSTAASANEKLDDRFTATAAFGMTWMQVDGLTNSGMIVQPTFNRAFDRFELQVDYMLGDLKTDEMEHAGSVLHRLGFAARHQVARLRIENSMTMDCVLEGGIGLQYLARDDGDAIGRNDFTVGLGLRTFTNVAETKQNRVFMGMEMMARFIVTPSGDKAFALAFGIPFGR